MSLIKTLKNPYIILIFVLILFMTAGIALETLEKAINNSFEKNPHTEIMLWQAPGYSGNPQLYFWGTEVHPSSDKIIVNYKMENKSDKAINIKNAIDVGIVKADANSIGEPGTLIWRWSQHHKDIGDKKLN